jgi:anionic cell wall polymer biosynthesis LytR-Cps2A-Psr (LCP) family protein
VASVAILLTSGAGWAAANRYGNQIIRVDAGTSGGALEDGEPLTMLVVASDDRSGLSYQQRKALHLGYEDYGQHTDTMMLVHLSGDGQSISVVSLPRDTRATIPAFTDSKGKRHSSTAGKFNVGVRRRGLKLMVETVEKMTGVTIDHYAEINFQGFTMVDAPARRGACPGDDRQEPGLDLPAASRRSAVPRRSPTSALRYIDPTADIGR